MSVNDESSLPADLGTAGRLFAPSSPCAPRIVSPAVGSPAWDASHLLLGVLARAPRLVDWALPVNADRVLEAFRVLNQALALLERPTETASQMRQIEACLGKGAGRPTALDMPNVRSDIGRRGSRGKSVEERVLSWRLVVACVRIVQRAGADGLT